MKAFQVILLVTSVVLGILAGLNVGSPRLSLLGFSLASLSASFLVAAI